MISVVLAFAIAGCGSSENATPASTTCGIPYAFTAPNEASVLSGSCAGMLPSAPPKLTIRRGGRVTVEIVHEQSGRLDFPVPRPTTDSVEIVSHSGATATYMGARVGTTTLVAHHTRFCAAHDPRFGSCPVLKVRVAP